MCRRGEFLENLTGKLFILPTNKLQDTVENYYDKIDTTAKIVDHDYDNAFS